MLQTLTQRFWRHVSKLVRYLIEKAPLGSLLLIAATIGTALFALVDHFLPLYLHEVANLCRRSWRVLLLHLPVLGALVPLLLVGTGLLGGGVLLGRQLRATHRFLHHLRAHCILAPADLHPLLEELQLAGRVCVIRDEAAHAFCYGLLWPRICVTTGLLALLTTAEQRALLAHEGHHLRWRDPLRKLLTDTLAGTLRFIPLVLFLHRAFQVAQEVAADEAAIRACGRPEPLASAIVKLLQRSEQVVLPPIAMSMSGVLEARLAHLLGDPSPLPSASGRALLSSLMVVGSVVLASYAAHSVMYTMPPDASECLAVLVGPP